MSMPEAFLKLHSKEMINRVLKDNDHANKRYVDLLSFDTYESEEFPNYVYVGIFLLNKAGHKASYLYDKESKMWVLGAN